VKAARLVVLAAVLTVVVGAPAARARTLDAGSGNSMRSTGSGPATGCVVHTGPAAQAHGAVPRDDVHLSGPDRLTRWIDRHPLAPLGAASQAATTTTTVPVYFHVIRKDLTAAGGNVTGTQVKQQIKSLNDSYGGLTGGARTGFQFNLKDVSRTTNSQWFHLTQGNKELQMKTKLKRGGPETLNIDSANLGNRLLGWSYFAQDAARDGALDGVVIHFQTLPGGGFTNYNTGDTATHEVGHWFNLYHTFENGCAAPGDRVSDTPTRRPPPTRARPAATPARRAATTRSTTSWTTPTTRA
jgi:Pregnancy-associated plasma protein-A